MSTLNPSRKGFGERGGPMRAPALNADDTEYRAWIAGMERESRSFAAGPLPRLRLNYSDRSSSWS
jgi:hypothetical protein